MHDDVVHQINIIIGGIGGPDARGVNASYTKPYVSTRALIGESFLVALDDSHRQ